MALVFVDFLDCDQCAEALRRKKALSAMAFVPSFPTQSELERHRVIVHGDFECPLCPWRFETRSGRSRHLKKGHDLSTPEIVAVTPKGLDRRSRTA